MTRPRIAVVLPPRETFTQRQSGAVALCVRDFAAYSRFASDITIFGAGACDYPEVRYRRVEGWRRWWKRDRAAYADAIASETGGVDLIEVQNRPRMIMRLRRPGTKLALHLHNDPKTMDGSRTIAERATLLRACDGVYCVSDFIRRRFLEGLTDREGRVVVVHNGVPIGPAARAAKSPVVAFTGRVIATKGVVELVRAFALASADLADWRLVIAGDDPDGLVTGPRSPVARERAALGARLDLRGQVSHAEALALLASAEVAAVPSLWDEPFARAAIEAMAAGCALIAAPRGGLAEIAEGAALMVEPTDTAGFAAALRRVALDASLRQSLQKASLRRASERFDIVQVAQNLDAARAQILGCA